MRRGLPVFLLVALLGFSSFLYLGHTKKIRAQSDGSGSACCGPDLPEAPRELDFPYYSLRDGFSSTLNLVSDSPKPIALSIALYGRIGETVFTQTTIQPGAKLALDLRQTLAKLGADVTGDFAEGSIAVYFVGTIMPVVGQVTISNPALDLIHESEMVENDPGRSDVPPVLNGLWWHLGGGQDASIMVSNMAGAAATADVYLDFGGQRHTAAPLTFLPHETKVLSISELLAGLGASAGAAPEGGITIIARGPNPKLIAQGRVLDPATGFSSTLEFPDPARQQTNALHADGLPIGTPTKDSPYAGAGFFTPHVIARNLASTPQTVTATVEYPKSATWNSSNGPGGPATPLVRYAGPLKKGEKNPNDALDHPPNPDPSTLTGQLTLAPITVGPYSAVDLSLDAALGQLPQGVPFCSVRIQYSGAPGSMIAQASSVDARQDLVVDARTMNEGDGWAGSGANPWHLDANTEAILFLTDASDKPARIGFSVTANGVHYYLTELNLAPHETRAIDIRKLRDAQVADFKGNRIPASATNGSVSWIRLDDVAVSGRVLVISRSGGVASSYDCCVCVCPVSYTALSVTPGTFDFLPGQWYQCTATGTYKNCNGSPSYSDLTDSATWSSNNTSVATVNSTGNADGVAGGSATISANFTGTDYRLNCQPPPCHSPCLTNPYNAGGSCTATVQVPTYLSIVAGSSTTSSETSCTIQGGQAACGASRSFLYQVLDQSTNPIHSGGMEFWDSITTSSPNDLNLTGYTTTCTGKMGPPVNGVDPGTNNGPCNESTNNSGQFQDTISVCAPACTSQGGFCILGGPTNALATWNVAGYSLRSDVKTYSYYCDHYLVNGQ